MKRWQGQLLQISPNLQCKNHEKKRWFLILSWVPRLLKVRCCSRCCCSCFCLSPQSLPHELHKYLWGCLRWHMIRLCKLWIWDNWISFGPDPRLAFYWDSDLDSDLDAMLTSNGQSRLGSGLSWATPTTPPLSTLGRREYIRKHSWDQWSPIHNYSQNQQLRWNCCSRKVAGKLQETACASSWKIEDSIFRGESPSWQRMNRQIYGIYVCLRAKEQGQVFMAKPLQEGYIKHGSKSRTPILYLQ